MDVSLIIVGRIRPENDMRKITWFAYGKGYHPKCRRSKTHIIASGGEKTLCGKIIPRQSDKLSLSFDAVYPVSCKKCQSAQQAVSADDHTSIDEVNKQAREMYEFGTGHKGRG